MIELTKAKLLQRSENEFNACAPKALGICKLEYEVITAQKL